ncbi:MAG: RelA/SpoT family protein, partial [Clostridia bacterium]
MSFEDLKAQLSGYMSEESVERVREAYDYAARAHRGQIRESGVKYIEHPLCVAQILADLDMDADTLAAALLHDVVEDSEASVTDIREEFGEHVADLVDGVTKLTKLEARTRVEEQAENLRKMFVAMAKDIRVILIKLADRLHNMRTLEYLGEEKRRDIAQETVDIFAPIAYRLGMSRIQWELEDLALSHIDPGAYQELALKVPQARREREDFTNQLITQMREALAEVGIDAEIQGRAKHLYSIYGKMEKQGKEIDEIYDLVAIRVIVDNVKDCYAVLGTVHNQWKPIPGRFKDYIAMPKSNMYQSLHTTVVGPEGEPFEIQIRTWSMHRVAEYGIAAHWRYKGRGGADEDFEKKLTWLREILEWQNEAPDPQEFMESLKIDVFSDEVFVFTPKGDVIDLPAGSTPIDFAYRIHTEVGHRCVGAKINGRIAPLDRQLETGDIVEVLTSKQSRGPSPDWLKIVKTSSARSRIRGFFKRERREENLERGRDQLRAEIREGGLDPDEVMREEYMARIRQRYSFQSDEELLVAIGYGGLTAGQVAGRLRDIYDEEHGGKEISLDTSAIKEPIPRASGDQGIRVKGMDNILVHLARCCNPVPGDPILGYVTRGRGVTIHRADCPNITRYLDDEERVIEVSWESVDAKYYPIQIRITAIDRPGLLSDVS